MAQIFDLEAWRQGVVSSFAELGNAIIELMPNLFGAVVILGVGWLVSKGVEVVARRALHGFGLDRVALRLPVQQALAQAGTSASASHIVARLLFWVLMLTFLLSAVEMLGLTAVTETIDRLIGYLPRVIAAGLLVLLGLLAGRFAQGFVSSAASAADLSGAARLGAATNSVVVSVVAILALEQLGISTEILVSLLSVVVGALVVTVGITFALGARPVVTHIMAGHFLRQSLPGGTAVEVGGQKGIVERVGPIDTLVRDAERSWSIPNARLLEETVRR